MKTTILLTSLLMIIQFAFGQEEIPKTDQQINSAIQAAPKDQRENATVMGYSSDGKIVVLREGSNDLVCLGDNPTQKGFNAACYPKDLEAFMSRGRELRAEGKSREEVFAIRGEEVKAGKLIIPTNATLHILYGTEAVYNTETMQMENVNYRYVVYIPYATPESTGLPLSPMVKGGPWIMDPGTHRAHIMITPPWPDK